MQQQPSPNRLLPSSAANGADADISSDISSTESSSRRSSNRFFCNHPPPSQPQAHLHPHQQRQQHLNLFSSQPLLAAPVPGSSSTSLSSSLDREPSREEPSLNVGASAFSPSGERCCGGGPMGVGERPLSSGRRERLREEEEEEEEAVMTSVSLPPLSRSPLPPPLASSNKRLTCGIRRSSRVVATEPEDEAGVNTDTTGSVSSSVTRGLSSGGNDADDEDDDDSVFAHVIIGVTTSSRRLSNSFDLGNTGRQRQRHLRFLRNVHSAQARLTQEHSFGSSREVSFELSAPKKKATKYLSINPSSDPWTSVERLKEEPDVEEEEDAEVEALSRSEDDSIGGLGERIRKLASRTIEFGDSIDDLKPPKPATSFGGGSGTGSGTTDQSSGGEMGNEIRRQHDQQQHLRTVSPLATVSTYSTSVRPQQLPSHQRHPTFHFTQAANCEIVKTNPVPTPLPPPPPPTQPPPATTTAMTSRSNKTSSSSQGAVDDSGDEGGVMGSVSNRGNGMVGGNGHQRGGALSCDRDGIRSATANAPFFSLSVESDTSHLSHESASTVITNTTLIHSPNNGSATSSATGADHYPQSETPPESSSEPLFSRDRLMSLSADVTAGPKDPTSVSSLSSAISSLASTLLNIRNRGTNSIDSKKLRSIVEGYSSGGGGGGGPSRNSSPASVPASVLASGTADAAGAVFSRRQYSTENRETAGCRGGAGQRQYSQSGSRKTFVRQDTPRHVDEMDHSPPPSLSLPLPVPVQPQHQDVASPSAKCPSPVTTASSSSKPRTSRRGAMSARRLASRFAMSDSSSSQSFGSMDKMTPPSIVCSQHEIENRKVPTIRALSAA
jgi:hypothetical protein